MHRTIVISLPADRTNQLISQIEPLECVLGLSVQRGGSIKPVGDVLTLQVLNKGIDEALRRIAAVCHDTTYSMATAEQASIIDKRHKSLVENDVDEAIWEEMETGMRHQAQITSNYLSLMAFGGVMAAVGLVSEPAPQVIAFVAASVVAPGFEPIAKIPLGLVLKNSSIIKLGLKSMLAGYGILVLASVLTFTLLRWLGSTNVNEFISNQAVHMMANPTAKDITVSLCGTLSGAIIIASYRRSIIAGALIAMVIISAAAMIGVGIASGQWNLACEGLERFGLDVALIIASCYAVFLIKQWRVHHRKPIV